MRIGQPVWHVVTGESCTGVVTELSTWRGVEYARVHWLAEDCEQCAEWRDPEEEDEWYQLRYLRKVGEPE